MTVQIRRYGLYDCADTARMGCVIVQIQAYGVCDCADTAV